jgi:hypothetical protein
MQRRSFTRPAVGASRSILAAHMAVCGQSCLMRIQPKLPRRVGQIAELVAALHRIFPEAVIGIG